MNKAVDLTVGVIISRDVQGYKCIEAILKSSLLPSTLSIIFIGSEKKYKKINEHISNFFLGKKIIEYVNEGRPAVLRNIIIKNSLTDDILLIDDDMYIDSKAIENFVVAKKRFKKNSYGLILGCAVIENGMLRHLGANFSKIWRDNVEFVRLERIFFNRFQIFKHDAERVDLITQPPFFISGVLNKKINFLFDENFPWANDIFDWFMEIKKQDIITIILPFLGAEHDPGRYGKIEGWEKKKIRLVMIIL